MLSSIQSNFYNSLLVRVAIYPSPLTINLSIVEYRISSKSVANTHIQMKLCMSVCVDLCSQKLAALEI